MREDLYIERKIVSGSYMPDVYNDMLTGFEETELTPLQLAYISERITSYSSDIVFAFAARFAFRRIFKAFLFRSMVWVRKNRNPKKSRPRLSNLNTCQLPLSVSPISLRVCSIIFLTRCNSFLFLPNRTISSKYRI